MLYFSMVLFDSLIGLGLNPTRSNSTLGKEDVKQ